MSAMRGASATFLAQVAPKLDEPITHLETRDRTAIVLRFFKRRDFLSKGEKPGCDEAAARMRLTPGAGQIARPFEAAGHGPIGGRLGRGSFRGGVCGILP
jgi:hypothetical protein